MIKKLLCVFLLVPFIAFAESEGADKSSNWQVSKVDDKNIFELLPEDKFLGNKDAKVVMIEYSSLSCPHCANFHTKILSDLRSDYIDEGKVLYIVRDFPINKVALEASKLTYCTGDKYFSYVDSLYDSQQLWAFNEDYQKSLRNIGKIGGISDDELDVCFSDEKLEDFFIQRSMEHSKILGIKQVPSIFINGKKFENERSYENFKAIFDEILNEKGSQ